MKLNSQGKAGSTIVFVLWAILPLTTGADADKNFGVCCFFMMLLLVGGFVVLVSNEGEKKQEKIIRDQLVAQGYSEAMSQLSNFTISQQCLTLNFVCSLHYDESQNKLAIIKRLDDLASNGSPQFALPHVYASKDIIEVQIVEDGSTIMQQHNDSTISRAVVGGILAGGAGAVVGAMTGKMVPEFVVSKLGIRIHVNDKQHPSYYVPLIDFSEPQKIGDFDYNGKLEIANHWFSLLKAMIRDAQNEAKDKPR